VLTPELTDSEHAHTMHFGVKRSWANVVILTTSPGPYEAEVCPTSADFAIAFVHSVGLTDADWESPETAQVYWADASLVNA